ncbi:hypothetical protein SKAU_G00095590 [Synaphobranchus kaupii]|uniref:HAT C-terminal dimerisation domain-containing protein n=1 Tax=Synaphobranchus kaupii TaxID=118154 RepID=A0A9Q1FYH3_SYNKA|nr:hypothetical protein SKAU_G00095590 [Synaphobranchus kaupii]
MLRYLKRMNTDEDGEHPKIDQLGTASNHSITPESKVLWQRLIQGAIGRDGQFQHMQVIAEISLVLPMSSSCCERGFSSMKRIKSDWRSCLSNEMPNCLLQISVHGPPAQDYDSMKAVTKWWSSGCRARRPHYKD